jgi:hypothetical protein
MSERSPTAVAVVLVTIVALACAGFLALVLRESNPAKQVRQTLSTGDRARAQAQIQSTLKAAAAAEESYASTHSSTYTSDPTELAAQGLVVPDGFALTAVATGGGYCLQATSTYTPGVWRLRSDEGAPVEGGC